MVEGWFLLFHRFPGLPLLIEDPLPPCWADLLHPLPPWARACFAPIEDEL